MVLASQPAAPARPAICRATERWSSEATSPCGWPRVRSPHRNRADALAHPPPAPAADARLLDVDLRDVGLRPIRARSHHALTAWPASRPPASRRPRGCRRASPRRQPGTFDCGRGCMGRPEIRRTGEAGWKKLHLGVERSGVIVARALTEASVDATTGSSLIVAVGGALGRGADGCRLRYDRFLRGHWTASCFRRRQKWTPKPGQRLK